MKRSLQPVLCCFALLLTSCLFTTATETATVPADLAESVQWYTGTTGTIDDPRARMLLEKSAATGNTLSTMWMARVYSTGRMTFTHDKERAQTLAGTVIADVERLAFAGNTEATFLMGTAYAEGLGKAVDPVIAATWYRQAAEVGHMLAQHNLGNSYAAGRGVKQDDAQAVYWWRLAAEAGDAIPQFMLGSMYEQGRGVSADHERALYWYRDASSRGLQRATDALERLSP